MLSSRALFGTSRPFRFLPDIEHYSEGPNILNAFNASKNRMNSFVSRGARDDELGYERIEVGCY